MRDKLVNKRILPIENGSCASEQDTVVIQTAACFSSNM